MTETEDKILVTGASGFVGRALLKELATRGIGCTPVYRRANAPTGLGGHLIDGIDGQTDWTGAFGGVSTIVHLAARVHVMNDRADSAIGAYRAVNLDGTVRLAELAAAAGVKRFIFVSSIKVNGAGTVVGHPYTAQSHPAPDDPYGLSKLEAEQALLAISAATGMTSVVIRPPLVYGPGVGANFHMLMRLAKCRFPLPFGSVRQNRRSLVAVGNLVDLIIHCCAHPAAAGRTLLVSDGEDLSTAELLERLANAMDRPSMLFPFPVGLMTAAASLLGRRMVANRVFCSLQVDISETQALLGWTPPFQTSEALATTVKDFMSSSLP